MLPPPKNAPTRSLGRHRLASRLTKAESKHKETPLPPPEPKANFEQKEEARPPPKRTLSMGRMRIIAEQKKSPAPHRIIGPPPVGKTQRHLHPIRESKNLSDIESDTEVVLESKSPPPKPRPKGKPDHIFVESDLCAEDWDSAELEMTPSPRPKAKREGEEFFYGSHHGVYAHPFPMDGSDTCSLSSSSTDGYGDISNRAPPSSPMATSREAGIEKMFERLAALDRKTVTRTVTLTSEEEGKESHLVRLSAVDPSLIPESKRDLISFVRNPPLDPYSGVMQCLIHRNRSARKTVYELRLDAPGSRLLMVARKKSARTAHYILTVEEKDYASDRKARGLGYLGKLRGGSKNREFILYDDGYNPKEVSLVQDGVRKELGIIRFPKIRPDEPGRMEVVLPSIFRSDGSIKPMQVFRPTKEDESIGKVLDTVTFKGGQNVILQEEVMCLFALEADPHSNTVDPSGRDTDLSAYAGRAHVPSVKNCQVFVNPPEDCFLMEEFLMGPTWSRIGALEGAEDPPGTVALQLGRKDRDTFFFDFTFPFSPMQAFAVAVARLDCK